MYRIFIVFILGLVLSGCSATWHINKAKQKCPDCFKTDTTITEVVFKMDTIIKLDTNILVFLPNDTVRIDSLVFKTLKPSFDKIIKKQGIITSEVEMIKGAIKVNSYLDSAFIYRLQDSIHIKDAKITNLKKIIVNNNTTIEKQIDWIKWLKIGLISAFVIIFIGAFIKFIKWVKR